MTRVTIIGGGPGGYEAAVTARDAGAEVTIIEESGLGGACVLDDCVPSKSFIATTGLYTEMRRANSLGMPIIESQKLDLLAINSRIKELAAEQSADIATNLEKLGIRIIRGKGTFSTDSVITYPLHAVEVTHEDGPQETLLSEIVLIATGASPRILPGAEPDGKHILNWRDIYNLEELPSHLIVIGSGVTGSEFVHAFTEMGVQITVLSSTDRMLPREDSDAARVLEDVLTERGVKIIRNAKAQTVRWVQNEVQVTLDSGEIIQGSHALMTVGSVPNTKNLGLDHVGVQLKPGGYIAVDRVSRTSNNGIYAAGDCTGVFPLASVAAMQGRIAIHHALGESVVPIKLLTVASAVFTRPEIASVGISQKLIDKGIYRARDIVQPLESNPRAKMQGLKHGFVKMFCDESTGVILGGVIVAPNASELISSLSLAVEKQLNVRDLSQTFGVYPSLSGSIIEASRKLVQEDELK